ncbi:hypothetical protein [Nocardia camponoti]|uniref:DNA-directed RNA polymerase subunit beta n=1 Tax=Nocardia camponoti TaxID=1616106 RepID=A0A917V4M8_9NOCA|nr:hypothetical protein [Nocardia camponoti]GGK39212.1 hypothetical protein GCM10011591_08620 [Nocardia camponoti]
MRTVTDSTLELRCVRYRREFCLPVSIDPDSRRILLRIGSAFGAVTMPSELGERVHARLSEVGVSGPVVAHPRAKRWTLLTTGSVGEPVSASASAELFRLYATVACAGSQIVLPSPDDERTGYRLWINPPDHVDHRPTMAAVIDAARSVGARKLRTL